MTALQNFIIEKMLDGCYIAPHPTGYRLRTADHCVIRKFHDKAFNMIRPLLRRKNGVYLINKNEVRQMHGSSQAKKLYKEKLKQNGKGKNVTKLKKKAKNVAGATAAAGQQVERIVFDHERALHPIQTGGGVIQ